MSYFYSDAWISRSIDNGASWSAPVQVDTNKEPLANSLGTDSYFPGVAVDSTSGELECVGTIGATIHSISRLTGSAAIPDGGASFTNVQITTRSFRPIHGADDQVNPQYMGDYDTVASDVLKGTGGFIGAFQVVAGEGKRTSETWCPTRG